MSSKRTRSCRGFALVVAVAGVLALPTTLLVADDNGKRQDGEGKYASLTALWWQWVLAQPCVNVDGTNTNPMLDSTGEFAAVGQENGIGPANKYFFLAGTFGGDATRTVTVPAGKALFFPMINSDEDNANDPPTSYTVPEIRASAKAIIDTTDVSSLYARVDDQDVEIVRTKSPTFSYTVPDENSIYDYFGLVGPQFEGTITPAVSDGYWAVIPRLSPGTHVVEFGGTNASGSISAIYFLTASKRAPLRRALAERPKCIARASPHRRVAVVERSDTTGEPLPGATASALGHSAPATRPRNSPSSKPRSHCVA